MFSTQWRVLVCVEHQVPWPHSCRKRGGLTVSTASPHMAAIGEIPDSDAFLAACDPLSGLDDMLSLITRPSTGSAATAPGLRPVDFRGPGLAAARGGRAPLLAVTIFVFVMLTFARAMREARPRALLKRPKPLVFACLWLVAAPALIIGGILLAIGRENLDPGIVLGLAIMAGAPPIMSAPAVAMMLGIEPTLLLTAVLFTTVIAPVLFAVAR